MKIPKSWLNDYVNVSDISNAELEAKLFSCGFEVEEVIEVNKNVKNIVTCKVIEKERHPDAEKLFVCKVDAGKYGVLQIVTNATNVGVGNIVPVALVGACLADGMEIKKGKLRGVESMGMFCGGEEIGITDEYYDGASNDSVLIFNDEFELGADVSELLDIRETVFDISITANRPDCQSVIGIAKEVSAVLKRPFKMPNLTYKTSSVATSDKVGVKVLDSELCSRYMAGYVGNIKIEKSPKWMQKRLALMGIRAINNIVDITNYVLMEIGQPMHAFDYRELTGKQIVVRRANEGEKIVTLDEKEFTLNNSNLVICDADKPSALAGIMGGLGSGIKEDTCEIVFESARFKRDNIRKSSKALGQRSDSSSRFEKGVDAYTTEIGLKRALSLICELGAGEVCSSYIDVNASNMNKKQINTTFTKINKLLGIEVPKEIAVEILTWLEFECKVDGDNLVCTVPLFREDVEGYPDLAEEIIRMYGYDHITPKLLDNAQITIGGRNMLQKKELEVKDFLVQDGFCEIITYSFISPKDYENFGYNLEEVNPIKLFNPLGEDVSLMRTTLLPSMVNAVYKNVNRKTLNGRLFELAKVYLKDQMSANTLPTEKLSLSLAVFGENEDFFTLKGVIEGMLKTAGYSKAVKYEPSQRTFMHPGRSAEVLSCDGETVGYMGELHPLLCEKLGLSGRIYVAEIDYNLISKDFNKVICFEGYSKYPSIERDLALVCQESVSNQQVIDVILSAKVKALKSVEIFDVYTGEHVNKGYKSLAYRLTFSSIEKTLGMEEVDGFVNKILKKLKENDIVLR